MGERALDDLPRGIERRRALVRRLALAVVWIAILEQAGELFGVIGSDEPASSSFALVGVGLGFFSAAAIGVDALVVGVRKRRGEGPSIRNLAPGGWVCFTGMFWMIGVPAYFLGARRRAKRGDDEAAELVPVGTGSYVAIVLFGAIGLLAFLGALLGALF